MEVEYFWKGPFTGATGLFLTNRYLALINVVINYFQLMPIKSDKVGSIVRACLSLFYSYLAL